MSLTIKRQKDNRVVKCILHRVADIPGGVTVHVANLGGSALFEGTPLAKGTNGMYEVCKTAQIITAATNTATTYEVVKAQGEKCERCWCFSKYVGTNHAHPTLCKRCADVIEG